MDETLFRILYCSRNLTGDTSGSQSQSLSQIFKTARANNGTKSVTGALLFNSGYFAQVLEGPKASIEQVFEKIQRDPRHGDVTVLECSRIDLRDFPDWSMARIEPRSEVQQADAFTALQGAFGDPTEAGRSVLDLMRTLVAQDD